MKIVYSLILLFVLATGVESQDVKLNLSHSTSFVVFPQDCNANPPMLFGGKILAEMDRCAGVTTRRLLYSSAVRDAVTVAINDVTFRKSGEVKDLIFVTGNVVELGKKYIKIHVTVEREIFGGNRELLADGHFVFVSYDVVAKKAVEHGLVLK